MEKQKAINSLVNAVAKQGRHKALANTMREVVPSIANQDYKIYGLVEDGTNERPYPKGFPAPYCGELYAAYVRAISAKQKMSVLDSFLMVSTGDSIARMICEGCWYDSESEQIERLECNHNDPAYYDALWAIELAIYNTLGVDGIDVPAFSIDNVKLSEITSGLSFINEDGYIINATAADGKLASLSLGERAENPDDNAVVRLESLLPLVGELPLDTNEIW